MPKSQAEQMRVKCARVCDRIRSKWADVAGHDMDPVDRRIVEARVEAASECFDAIARIPLPPPSAEEEVPEYVEEAIAGVVFYDREYGPEPSRASLRAAILRFANERAREPAEPSCEEVEAATDAIELHYRSPCGGWDFASLARAALRAAARVRKLGR